MKTSRHLILFVFISISISAKSQFTKGDRLIGGGVAFNASNNSNTSIPNTITNLSSGVNTSLVPRYSWVSGNNVMNGVFISGSYSHAKNSSSTIPDDYAVNNSYSVGAGYFIRQFKDFSPQFGWFVEYNALFSYSELQSKNHNSSTSLLYKSSGISAGVNVIPGLYYKLSRQAVIEASFGGVGANYYRNTNSSYKDRRFNVALDFPSGFSVGFQFLLNNKKGNK